MSNKKTMPEALIDFQSSMQTLKKTKENPFFKSNYCDLAGVWDAIRKPLTDHGFAVVQTTKVCGEKVALVTTLIHASGEKIEGEYPLTPVKNDPQAMGSAVTYARRYALMSILGLVAEDEDDDGNTATQKAVNTVAKTFPNARPVGKFKTITEKQAKRFYAIAKSNGKTDEEMKDYLQSNFGSPKTGAITPEKYDEAVAWAEGKEAETVEFGDVEDAVDSFA